MKQIKQKIGLDVDFRQAYELISKFAGCGVTQKDISKALGLGHGDLANRKRRGTAAQYIINWGAERGIAAEELFPELKRLQEPEPEIVSASDPPNLGKSKTVWGQDETPAQDQLPYGHDLVRLPRGDPKPLTKLEADTLEKTLEVIRTRGEGEHFAENLLRNVNSFHKGILLTASRTAEPGEEKKSKAS